MSEWLTREQIDEVLENLSAADIIEGTTAGEGAQMAGVAFNSAAARMNVSNGTTATAMVRAGDFAYLATRLGEVLNVDGPKLEETSSSLGSVDTGA